MLWRVEPCLPTSSKRVPVGPQWVHEIKHDGYRLWVRRQGARVRVFTRRGYDWSHRFPLIVEAIAIVRFNEHMGTTVLVLVAIQPSFYARSHFPNSRPVRFALQVAGGFPQRDHVCAIRDAPLVDAAVESREQARIGRHCHLARLTGRELHPLESKQPHSLLARRICEIKLRYVSASRLPVFVTVKLAAMVSPPRTCKSAYENVV